MQIKTFTISELQEIRKNLVNEFTEANKGAKNSLAFAKNKIQKNEISDNGKAQVIVIGGSNLATGIVEKKDGHVHVISQKNEELPVFKSKELLLEFIHSHLEEGVDRVGLNFAYPLNTTFRDGKLDGQLIKGTKEHTFDGLVGNNVGQTIEEYILEKTGRKIDVVVANDTVCLVLSGLEKDKSINLVGGVVGTGFNFGFFINEDVVVNLESGNFNKFPVTDSGQVLDSESQHPGFQLWEKEISGAYLYLHYNYYVEKNNSEHPAISSSVELSMIAAGEKEGDKELASSIIKRAAELVATQIAAIYDFKDKNPITVIIEGSLYWKGCNFSNFVKEFLSELEIDINDIKIEFIDNSSVIGAAQLIM